VSDRNIPSNERTLREALECLLPGLILDLRYATDDDDKDAMRSRITTVQDALASTVVEPSGQMIDVERNHVDRAEIVIQRALNCGWITATPEGLVQLRATIRIALDTEVRARGPHLDRSPAETTTEPEDDPANAEVIARLKQAFGGDPDARVLGPAMCKIADGAMGPAHGCAILTHRECDAIGKEIRRLNRAARGESSEKTSREPPEDPHADRPQEFA
jgi:hypothetical protein